MRAFFDTRTGEIFDADTVEGSSAIDGRHQQGSPLVELGADALAVVQAGLKSKKPKPTQPGPSGENVPAEETSRKRSRASKKGARTRGKQVNKVKSEKVKRQPGAKSRVPRKGGSDGSTSERRQGPLKGTQENRREVPANRSKPANRRANATKKA